MTMRWRMLAICSTENRRVLESAIVEWSLEVCWCLTLQEARRGLRRGNLALVLCEAELPDGTYQDVMKLLKHKLDQIRVIVMSATHVEDCYSQAIEMGAFDVISAPCKRTDIQWVIMQAVQGHPAATDASRKGQPRGGPSSFAVA
jgi:DNA-binding NtrC family response regulator